MHVGILALDGGGTKLGVQATGYGPAGHLKDGRRYVL